MKKIFIILFISIHCVNVFSQEKLFYINKQSDIIATKDKKNTCGLFLNNYHYNEIISERPNKISCIIPFFNRNINLDLEKFDFYNNIQVVSKNSTGEEYIDLRPNLLSYKLHLNNNVIGILNFVNNSIVASFKIKNKQYEISEYNNEYILFETANSINKSSFSCAVQDQHNNNRSFDYLPEMNSNPSAPVCVELAIEIDNYTRQTFSTDQETLDWALAIIAGVSQVYESETNSAIQVVYSYIWNTTDPYDPYVAQASAMLSELKNYWITNNAGVNRDLVHLLTKRNNTGTGGIAYVDALCSSNWGYGFSASLSNDTTFVFPNPTYSWNLNVVAHEIGHNYGSKHTHWCGWVADAALGFNPVGGTGVIDNCVDVEGSCPNNPLAQVGTIMSYCHTTSSGSIIDFHPVVVDQALDVGIANAGCLTTCDYYGCTDTSAFNYNANATIDDGSCIPKIYGCTDTTAANFNPLANTLDGSCTYCASLTFNNTDITCLGFGDGIVQVNVNGSSGTSFSYQWLGPNGFSSSTNVNYIDNLSQAGNYTVIVTDNLGCIDSMSSYLNEPSLIVINGVNTTPVSCNSGNDGVAVVDVMGGTPPYNYNFNGYNPNALTAGSYSVAVGDVNNCPLSIYNFTISEPDVISDNAIKNDISCFNFNDGSISLTMTGGVSPFNYSWIGPNGYTSILKDISGLSGGVYQLSILDSNNCQFNNIFNIINPSALDTSAVLVTDIDCNGGNNGNVVLNVNGGTLPYSFLWSNGDTNSILTNVSSGNYNVIISDNSGCVYPTLYFNLSEPFPSIIIDTIHDIDCYGNINGAIDITYITADTNISTIYNWQGPNSFFSNLEDINNLSAGTYVLNITENNHCQNTFSLVVLEPDPIQVSEQVQGTSCYNGNDGSVVLSIIGGTPLFVENWNGNNPQLLSHGVYNYTVTDANGCNYTDTVYVSEPLAAISVIDSVKDVSCFNYMDGMAYLSISGGVNPYFTSWPNSNPTALLAGYNVFEILDGNNCLFVDSVYISQPDPLLVNVQNEDVLCNGMNTGSAQLQVIGGVYPYTYIWSNADTSQTAVNLSAGSYIYYVTDNNGCQTQGIASINQSSPISVQHSITPSTCVYTNDGSVSVSVNGGYPPYSQSWMGIDSSALSSGLFNYLIIDSVGCIDSNTVFVNSLSNINSFELLEHVSCYGYCDGNINLIINNGVSPYIINYYDVNNLTVNSNQLCSGIYDYEIIDDIGCVYTDSFEINQPDLLYLQVQLQPNLLKAVVSGGIPSYSFQWWDSNGPLSNLQDLYITQPGTYYCIAYDANNCHSDTVEYFVKDVSVIDLDSYLNIYPNPVNDYLIVDLDNYYDDVIFLITDVLGKEIYNSKKIKNIESFNIDCSYFADGVYFLHVKINNQLYTKKFIIE